MELFINFRVNNSINLEITRTLKRTFKTCNISHAGGAKVNLIIQLRKFKTQMKGRYYKIRDSLEDSLEGENLSQSKQKTQRRNTKDNVNKCWISNLTQHQAVSVVLYIIWSVFLQTSPAMLMKIVETIESQEKLGKKWKCKGV